MEPMDIYIANVPFDENNRSKVRPALVIEISQDSVMVFKITSQFKNKSIKIKNLYYPIEEWNQAGLKKQSYVDIHKLYKLPQKWIFRQQPIGKLTDNDKLGLFNFIKRKQK